MDVLNIFCRPINVHLAVSGNPGCRSNRHSSRNRCWDFLVTGASWWTNLWEVYYRKWSNSVGRPVPPTLCNKAEKLMSPALLPDTCIVLNLYIYIALLAVLTHLRRCQCKRPSEKRAVLIERREALGSPVNKVDRVEGRSWFLHVAQRTPCSFLCMLQFSRMFILWLMALFIHSFGHFYSAPSSPLLLRGAPDYSTDTVSEFHLEAHRQLQVKDLPMVPTWWLERESNPRPSGWKSSSQPRRHHVCSVFDDSFWNCFLRCNLFSSTVEADD